ncbi:MAG: NAD-dependent epimerase/dehydratase family protein [Ferruginibacter sp.]
MKILITGASGYLGNKLANKLAEGGNEVHALVRSSSSEKFLQHLNITVFKGDILNKGSLMTAMKGCSQVYHTAAKVGAWAKDPSVFYNVNVEGTKNVLDAALISGVEKIVFTSTSGVIGPTLNKPLEENDLRLKDLVIDYDLSKKNAEDLVINYAKEGMNVVIVSPSKVYGPGNVSHSLTANAIINTFLKKGITFIPSPGNYKVCFAFADDVVNGHILAMEKGLSGEKYILGGINISYYDFFHRIRTLAHCSAKIIKLPKGIITTWAGLQELTYKVFGLPVRFTVKSVDHAFSNYTFSSRKAMQDLNYSITPLDEALLKTIHFLKNIHHD